MKFTIWKVASSPSSVLYISTDTYRTYLFHQSVYLINALLTTVIIFFYFFPLVLGADYHPYLVMITFFVHSIFPHFEIFIFFQKSYFYLGIFSLLILWCCDEAWVF